MSFSDSTSAYIAERLQAGATSEQIAQELRAQGLRALEEAPTSKQLLLQKISSFVFPVALLIVGFSIPAGMQLVSSAQPTRSSVQLADTSAVSLPYSPENVTVALTENVPSILGVATDSAEATSASKSATAIPLKKDEYKIALLGDSMIDTLDADLPLLKEELEKKYKAEFTLYNYGIGSENVELGLARFEKPLSYKDRNYPALSELKADVIVIGSFAYNPFEVHDVNKYWLTMAQLIQKAQATKALVFVLADIAPLYEKFGVGTLDWDTETRKDHAEKVAEQLDSVIALSQTLKVPLIDLYTESKKKERFGDGSLTSNDGIHANEEGRKLVVKRLVEQLTFEESSASNSAKPAVE